MGTCSSPSAMTDPMGLSPEIDAAVEQHNAYLAEVWALYKSGTISPCEVSRLSNLSNESTLGRIERAEQLSDRWDVKLSASAKALGNSTVDTVVSGVTLGFVDGVEVWTPNAYEQSAYGTAYGFARVSSEIGFGLALGAAQGVKGASALTRFVSGSMFALDMGGNAVSFGRGAYSMYEDGITWENALQAGSGLAGFSGNMGGLFRAKPSLHATHVAENTFHYDKKIFDQLGPRGWTDRLIDETISAPHTTRASTNRYGDQATVYYRKDGHHVVRVDATGEIIQVTDRFKPTWRPDSRIQNPFQPE